MAKYKLTEKEEEAIEKTIGVIRKRLQDRVIKRKGQIHSNRHETLGKVTEEYFEYITEVKKQSKKKQRAELYDIADACLFGILSI